MVSYKMTAESIRADEGRLLAAEAAWQDDAERILRESLAAGQPGAAVELAGVLRQQAGREAEAEAILSAAAAQDGYLRAYGILGYLLEDLGRHSEALEAFRDGLRAGERKDRAASSRLLRTPS